MRCRVAGILLQGGLAVGLATLLTLSQGRSHALGVAEPLMPANESHADEHTHTGCSYAQASRLPHQVRVTIVSRSIPNLTFDRLHRAVASGALAEDSRMEAVAVRLPPGERWTYLCGQDDAKKPADV